jgi:MFS transporter, Spinster family, sphingosine-1-phosphate transporter
MLGGVLSIFGGLLGDRLQRRTPRGRALVAAVGILAGIPPPVNYAAGLALFQVFFVPTGVMYWLASRTVPGDIDTGRDLLRERARQDREPAPA